MYFLIFILLLIVSVFAFFSFAPQMGKSAKGERLQRIQDSPNFKDGVFQNPIATNMGISSSDIFSLIKDYRKDTKLRTPTVALPTKAFDKDYFESIREDSAAFCWFGHSSLLLKIQGITILTDPVFSERASLVSFAGPKHFEYQHRFTAGDLPKIDLLILSHDHYDHLDYKTIKALIPTVGQYLVPLGVGAHLESWGVVPEKIIESDWWETHQLQGLEITSAPSRHFSGRGISNRNTTLWCSWAIKSQRHNVYYGADSGFHPIFNEIGDKLGPFDIAFIECGAYSKYWADIHMLPEESVQAGTQLNTKIAMPIHWGKFNLSIHPWKEPIERFTKRANEVRLPYICPLPGKIVMLNGEMEMTHWWEGVD